MRDAELVIVGGGPAGLSTALHVQARAPKLAERAIVLEAERYPREKICAGGVGARAFAVLERIGVELDVPMTWIDQLAIRYADDTAVIREPKLAAVVRRVELDHALAKTARARGIDVRDGAPVAAIDTTSSDRVIVTLASGEQIRARAVVGADGVGGIVRRSIGIAPSDLRAQVVELDTEAAAADFPRDTAVFDFTAPDLAGYAWDFPTLVGGEPLVCRGVYVLHEPGRPPSASPRARLGAYLAARGLDLARYRVKQFAERGFEPGAPLAVPRVLLAGEAAGIDIATGEGIAQAIEYGALAGAYLARAFAADDLSFAGWRGFVARRHVGRQLRIRHACYRAFYGAGRPRLERLLAGAPQLMRLGVQDFAGKRLSPLALVHGTGQLLRALVRESARDADHA